MVVAITFSTAQLMQEAYNIVIRSITHTAHTRFSLSRWAHSYFCSMWQVRLSSSAVHWLTYWPQFIAPLINDNINHLTSYSRWTVYNIVSFSCKSRRTYQVLPCTFEDKHVLQYLINMLNGTYTVGGVVSCCQFDVRPYTYFTSKVVDIMKYVRLCVRIHHHPCISISCLWVLHCSAMHA